MVWPGMVSHLSANPDQCSVTSLMCLTMLPLSLKVVYKFEFFLIEAAAGLFYRNYWLEQCISFAVAVK